MSDSVIKTPTHALVRYSDELRKATIIKIEDIYNFEPKKFDDNKPYVMKWFCPKDKRLKEVRYDVHGWNLEYYKGQINLIGDEEEVKKALNNRTLRWKTLIGELTDDEEIMLQNKPARNIAPSSASTTSAAAKVIRVPKQKCIRINIVHTWSMPCFFLFFMYYYYFAFEN